MKRNSPGCTCCQPIVFGNQTLWVLNDVSHALTNNLTGFNDATLQDVPTWVIIVNSWGTLNPADVDYGTINQSHMGFNHEFAGIFDFQSAGSFFGSGGSVPMFGHEGSP
jgi:hypothetical protein